MTERFDRVMMAGVGFFGRVGLTGLLANGELVLARDYFMRTLSHPKLASVCIAVVTWFL